MPPGSRKRLERRLLPILDLLPRDVSVFADVACDHGMLATAALLLGKAKKVIASDVNERPLQNAVEHIHSLRAKGRNDMPIPTCTGFTPPEQGEAESTTDNFEFRLGDGVGAIEPGELVDSDGKGGALAVAGVGTQLMCQRGGILEGTILTGAEFLLLQPSSYDCRHMRELRLVLRKTGWDTIAECCTKEGQHFRISLCAVPTGPATVDPIRDVPHHGKQCWSPIDDDKRTESLLLFGNLVASRARGPKNREDLNTTRSYLESELRAFQDRKEDRRRGGLGPDPFEELWMTLTEEALDHFCQNHSFENESLKGQGPGAYPGAAARAPNDTPYGL